MRCSWGSGMVVRGQLWAIIYGEDEDQRPEIFHETLARVEKVVSKKRIVVVATEETGRARSEEPCALPPENCLELPCDRGTPAAALLAFFHVFRKEPTSRVLLIPAHHRVKNERSFLEALEAAAECTP